MRNCTSESSEIASPSARAGHLDLADNTDLDRLLRQMTEMIKEIEDYFEHVDHQLPTNQAAHVGLHVRHTNKRKFVADESRQQRHKRQKTSPTAEYNESPVPMKRRMLTNANLARLFDVVVKRVEKDMIK